MDLQTSDADGIQKGMENMERAFEIYPYCTMALNHLANHFFFTGQHFLVEQLTEVALAVGNHSLMKSHAYYNLARSYHSKGDFEKAGRYYMASVNEISKPQEFILHYYGLAQVQLKLGDFRSSLSNFEKILEFCPENSDSLKSVGYIYAHLGQTEKALKILRKATKYNNPQEQWKITGFSGAKRKSRPLAEDDDAGYGEEKQRKAGKRKRKHKKRRERHELEEEDEHSDHEVEDEEENMVNDHDDEGTADVQNRIRATGLEDSDVEENNMVSPSTAINRRRRAWPESDDEGDGNGDDDEKASRKEDDIDNSSEMAGSGGEIKRDSEN